MIHEFLKIAQEELDQAISHYNRERAGLGDEFGDEVDIAIEKIINAPEAWPFTSKDIRCCYTKRFPYGVLYRVREGKIVIVAVVHLHRRPGYWKRRLKDS